MNLTKEDFYNKENSYLISMIGCDENIKKFYDNFNFLPTVFWGLDTKNPISSIKYNPNANLPPDIYYYINSKSGTIGCHMAHFYAIWNAFLNNKDFIIIMEDDAFPIISFEELSDQLKEVPDDWECINIGWIPSIVLNERKVTPIPLSDNIYKQNGMECSGAFGYILNKKGIENAINVLSDIRIPTDLMFKFLKTYYIKKPFLGHPPAYAPSRIR